MINKKGLIILLLVLLILSESVNAGFWQEQAIAFREHGDKLGSDQFPDYNKAYHFYCVSTAMHDDEAAFNIANLYFNGQGVERNPGIAKGWLEYAAKLGHLESINQLRKYQDIPSRGDTFCPKHDPLKTLNKNDIMVWVNIIAPTFGLDPMMVNAVIKVESGFNPKAISSRNAQGLMQLIPSTAQRFGVQNSFDPVQNLFGGIAYLRYLLQMFSGDLSKAWAAYNAGEAAVIRNKGVPPFAETIQYVRMLLAMYPRTSSPVNIELPFVFADKNTL